MALGEQFFPAANEIAILASLAIASVDTKSWTGDFVGIADGRKLAACFHPRIPV